MSALDEELAAVIQPVIDAWMDGDHGGTIYTKELTDLIVEELTVRHVVALYNAGYRAGRRAEAYDSRLALSRQAEKETA